MEIAPIAYIESPYPTKFGVPRQPALVTALTSRLSVPIEYFDGRAEELEPGSFVVLLWEFSFNHGARSEAARTVRAPRLGGTERVGVFASRSSFRPNSLALSTLEVKEAMANGERLELEFYGGDLVDGTPVYGLRGYGRADVHENARAGWVQQRPWNLLDDVVVPEALRSRIADNLWPGIEQVLRQDPRPAYTKNSQSDREFWVPICHYVIRFRVEENNVVVTGIEELSEERYAQLKMRGSL
ncbi:MAG: TrmO family methyltransferase domain-containing protein [Coriobacteriales bacterium]|jgi:tRNA-Thr(GGU) m(6)t(6)A37 methyltransferase TsaA